jgi:PKD repeat protein
MWNEYYNYATGTPIALFNVDTQKGKPPLSVKFNASDSSDSDGYIVDYSWDFGDGESGNGKNVEHVYNVGAFVAKLTVTDNSSNIVSSTKAIIVNNDIQPNLIFYMNFDDSILDNSGNMHTISCGINGCPEFVSGRRNSAAYFNGTLGGASLSVLNAEDLSGMKELTMSVWAKKNNATTGGLALYKSGSYSMSVYSNYFNGHITNSSTTATYPSASNSNISSTEWHHYVIIYNGSIVRTYFDGNELIYGTRNFGGNVGILTNDLSVGKSSAGVSFNGAIDELRIYDKALTQQEISDLYNLAERKCVIGRAYWQTA